MLAKAKGIGTNPNCNPLKWSRGNATVSSTQFVLAHQEHNCNILLWAADMVRHGRAEEATSELLKIRGIGPKIAAFYLRDVAWYFALDEEPPRFLQPVDLWIRRIAESWAAFIGRSVDDDDDIASVFVNLARAADVRGGDLNAGAWVLGSLFSGGSDLGEVVCNWPAFSSCIKTSLARNDAVGAVLHQLPT